MMMTDNPFFPLLDSDRVTAVRRADGAVLRFGLKKISPINSCDVANSNDTRKWKHAKFALS